MTKKIILYGAKSTGYIFYEILKEKKIKPKYLFDPFLKKPFFKIVNNVTAKAEEENNNIKPLLIDQIFLKKNKLLEHH